VAALEYRFAAVASPQAAASNDGREGEAHNREGEAPEQQATALESVIDMATRLEGLGPHWIKPHLSDSQH
jgi:hypothetical protein